jgi:hypothetical protein
MPARSPLAEKAVRENEETNHASTSKVLLCCVMTQASQRPLKDDPRHRDKEARNKYALFRRGHKSLRQVMHSRAIRLPVITKSARKYKSGLRAAVRLLETYLAISSCPDCVPAPALIAGACLRHRTLCPPAEHRQSRPRSKDPKKRTRRERACNASERRTWQQSRGARCETR